ncbi:hypothetical protein AB0P17_20690 [Streptomyces sp. NPDC088124]|uniref:hypothetical protein n=1 Tax=Streptomyces sp. NPDC088124 TaxID=3154654 RepID=UPI003435CE9B
MSDQRKSEESGESEEKGRQGEDRRSGEMDPGPGARTALRVPRQTRAGAPGPAGAPAARGTGEASEARDGASEGPAGRLFPRAESDRLSQRLQEALNSFVDEPRNAVEAAAVVLEEAAERLSTALAERPRALRSRWDVKDGGTAGDAADGAGGAGPDTEELRLALQSYREMTRRLLRV